MITTLITYFVCCIFASPAIAAIYVAIKSEKGGIS